MSPPWRALSIRQPWAWLISQGVKDVENRSWSTTYRGPLLIHAARQQSQADYHSAEEQCRSLVALTLPAFEALPRGAYVGVAELTDCVWRAKGTTVASPWHWPEHWGFRLARACAIPIITGPGRLGLFRPDDNVLRTISSLSCHTMPRMAQGSLTAIRLRAMLAEPRTRKLALREILTAFEADEGNALHAARRLGVSHRALLRWIADYSELEREVGKLRARHDHRHRI